MITPLDPVIAQIIPLLPLRDPDTMTPQSGRDALRARGYSAADGAEHRGDGGNGGRRAAFCARLSRLSGEVADRRLFPRRRLGRRRPRNACPAGPFARNRDRAVVISVDYRCPPETRFPGAFEDALAAVRDAFERIAEFDGDNMRVGVAGDSAGGNLAAAVAIDALQATGVSTKRHPGLIHGYFGMGEASEAARPEAQRARADFKAMLERGA